METPIIREEVQAFLQACQSFMGFKQYTRLTTAERQAIANIVQTLGSDSKPSPGEIDPSFIITHRLKLADAIM